MNINHVINIAYNPKYSHCTKLSQHLFALFVLFFQTNPLVSSTDIIWFLAKHCQITITKSWINQKLAQCGCIRKRGRPTKTAVASRSITLIQLKRVAEAIEQIGIPFLLAVMEALGFTDLFVSTLQKEIQCAEDSKLPTGKAALIRFINTLAVLTLDPRAHNFEEAFRVPQPHMQISVARAARLIKEVENLPNILPMLQTRHIQFWISLLKLDDPTKEIILYIDGHGFHYFTKNDFLTGRMSGSNKIAPGTHSVVVTMQDGFVLSALTQDPNTHLNAGLESIAKDLLPHLGARIQVIVVDRECNGLDLMLDMKEKHQLTILTGLRSNQYTGWDDFIYDWIEDGKIALACWSDPAKRARDPRDMLVLKNEDGGLYVLTTTCADDAIVANADEYQKSRWAYCENVLKSLVVDWDINVNVCNGVHQVENPKLKQLETKKAEQQQVYESKILAIDDQLSKTNQPCKLKALQGSRQKWEKRQQKADLKYREELANLKPELGARKLEPQGLMSLLRIGLYNVLLFLMTQSVGKKHGLSLGMERIKGLLINQKGRMEATNEHQIFYFECPQRFKDREVLEEFFEGVNRLMLKDNQGRIIMGKLLPGAT